MEPEHHRAFGPFHVDGTQGHLWRGDQRIALRPQSLALLRYLVAHPGRLVTKAEVRQHVWAGMHITDTVLRVSVHEIRQALGDAVAAPRYLETVGRQGYRFLLGDALESPPPRTTDPLSAPGGVTAPAPRPGCPLGGSGVPPRPGYGPSPAGDGIGAPR
jgi:DNA-binding winged helix-turn-helix (wHTH) protein